MCSASLLPVATAYNRRTMTGAGIYIHIPFCKSRCSYCDFATGMYEGGLAERYVGAVCSEIENWTEINASCQVDTVYFGGGTPSLLRPDQIQRILNATRAQFEISDSAEITLEINPGDARKKILSDFRRLGINRASFGAQTFDDQELKQLGRTHNARDISTTFHQLRAAGFRNINFDLIAGLPGQTLSNWKRNLSEALSLGPEHLSLY